MGSWGPVNRVPHDVRASMAHSMDVAASSLGEVPAERPTCVTIRLAAYQVSLVAVLRTRDEVDRMIENLRDVRDRAFGPPT